MKDLPIDGFSNALSSVLIRVCAFAVSIAAGLILGQALAEGTDFNLRAAFFPILVAAIAWLVSPAFLLVLSISLFTLFSILATESTAVLLVSTLVLAIAWTFIGFTWA